MWASGRWLHENHLHPFVKGGEVMPEEGSHEINSCAGDDCHCGSASNEIQASISATQLGLCLQLSNRTFTWTSLLIKEVLRACCHGFLKPEEKNLLAGILMRLCFRTEFSSDPAFMGLVKESKLIRIPKRR